MSETITLSDGATITYEDTKTSDDNIVCRVASSVALRQFYEELGRYKHVIEALVRHHLKLDDQDRCIVAGDQQWIRGNFNVCVPIEVRRANRSKLFIFRCPMPHKHAEVRYPGTIDEKMGCEVGAYVWMQTQCPDIRIPHLYGFGFSDGRCFTHENQQPFYVRIARMLQRVLRNFFRCNTILSRYGSHPTNLRLPTAHMLLEYIGPEIGEMLSNTWDAERKNSAKRRTLLQGLAGLVVSLARIPQPRIGSFQFNNDCTISLTGRPLTWSLMLWESNGMPRTITRNDIYSCAEPYVSDLIACQENMFLSDPNAAFDDYDCRGRMASICLTRLLAHRFVKREHRHGPFLLQLTDINRSNIYVDKDWKIKCIIDLEWVCALPVEALVMPAWLAGHAINKIKESDYDDVRQEFVHAVEQEELKQTSNGFRLARTMDETWRSGATWLWTAVNSNVMYSLLWRHVYHRFQGMKNTIAAEEILSGCWREDSANVVSNKANELRDYRREVAHLFNLHGSSSAPVAPSP